MRYVRGNIERMSGYVPGFQPSGSGFIKLNTNENPYGPSPRVSEAIAAAANESLRLYPDPMSNPLRDKIAEVYGLKREQVLAGNGSDDLLSMISRCFLGPGDRAVYPYPTYLLYETLCRIQDAQPVEIDFEGDYALPAEIFEAEGKVLFLCNPNSPSGTMVAPEEVKRLAGSFAGILVVDEAYVDFAERDCLKVVRTCGNVIVLRTLSKSFSLAGIRCGFAAANEEIIMELAKVKDSYNLDRLSIVAGVAALSDMEHMRRNAARIRKTRSRLSEELGGLGFQVYASQSNFVLARISEPPALEMHNRLAGKRIFVRYLNMRRLEDCLRITVGTDAEVDRLLEELAEIVKT